MNAPDAWPNVLIVCGLLWLVVWLAWNRRRRNPTYSELLKYPQWINLSWRLRKVRRCYICGSEKDLEVHHARYIMDYDGSKLVPWDELYLHLKLLKVVCRTCHDRLPKAEWIRLDRI